MKALMKRKWGLPVGLFAVALLALGLTGGAIFAQEGDTERDAGGDAEEENARQGLASRVAEILGLGEEEVQEAFEQAHRGMRDDRFQSRIDRLVERGRITEDEAAEAIEWYQSRPDKIGPGHRGSRMHGGGHRGGASKFGRFGMCGASGVAPGGF